MQTQVQASQLQASGRADAQMKETNSVEILRSNSGWKSEIKELVQSSESIITV